MQAKSTPTRLYTLLCIDIDTCSCFLFIPEDLLPFGFPSIDMGPQLKVVERTKTATMLCAASGIPDPEISWFKDFLPVEPSLSQGRIKQLRSGERAVNRASKALLSNKANPCCSKFGDYQVLIMIGGLHAALCVYLYPLGM